MNNAANDALTTVESAGPLRAAQGTIMGAELSYWRDAMREELRLPGGLLVGTGHQVEWWHPGIAAKFMWANAVAMHAGAATVWLIIDTDIRDPRELRVPVSVNGEIESALHRFGPRALHGTPACVRSVCQPTPFEDARGAVIPPCAAAGTDAAYRALLAHSNAADCTTQVLDAVRECTPELGTPGCTVRSSQLMKTALGMAIVERAARDPHACARAFNAAVAVVPRVARTLAEDGPLGPELPLWTRGSDGTRHRVHAAELAALRAKDAPLWPRAFLTSAMARAVLSDRFVHGTGGKIYERATDMFAQSWLDARLPAFDVASATLRLPFSSDALPPPVTAAARRARWFDPESTGYAPSASKLAALTTIANAPRASAARRSAWLAMHAELGRARSVHAAEIQALDAQHAADRIRARAAQLRADRTWAAVLHPPHALAELAESLRRQCR